MILISGNLFEYEVDKLENLGVFSYYIEIFFIFFRIYKFFCKFVDISVLLDVE